MRAVLLSILLFSAGFSGCLGIVDESEDVDPTEGYPEWKIGDWWLYTFVTPEFGEDSARLVVAERNEVDEHWMLGISSEREAQRHAVVNHNPFLGRVTFGDLSVFENGEPQQVFNFPWTQGDTWKFTLLGESWNAQTSNVNGDVATVTSTSDNGHSLADTGIRHVSGDLHSEVWERYEEVLPYLMSIKDAARKMAEAVQNDRRDLLVEAMRSTTEAVDGLSPELNDPYRILDESPEILAWKGMGAAAGGFVAIITRDPIKTKENLAWDTLDWSVDHDGLILED